MDKLIFLGTVPLVLSIMFQISVNSHDLTTLQGIQTFNSSYIAEAATAQAAVLGQAPSKKSEAALAQKNNPSSDPSQKVLMMLLEGDKSQAMREAIVQYAKQYLGLPYIYGGTTPRGFDCSGFVQYVYKHFDFDVTRVPSGQIQFGKYVKKEEARKGDIVFYGYPSGSSYVYTHVALVYENTPEKGLKVIHSANMGLVVTNIHFDPSPRTQLICIKSVLP